MNQCKFIIKDENNPDLKVCTECSFEMLSKDPPERTHAMCKIQKDGPGILRKALNFGKALTTQLLEGNPMCSQEQIEERLDICKGCEFFIVKQQEPIDGECSKCGCKCNSKISLMNKLSYGSQSCPIGKWKEIVVNNIDK